MEYLPYEHFRAFASQLMTRFRTQEHLECLLVMFRHAASLRVEYFVVDEHFLLGLTKVLCIRSSAIFVREAPEVGVINLLLLFLFSDYIPVFQRWLLASAISFIACCSKETTVSICLILRTTKMFDP